MSEITMIQGRILNVLRDRALDTFDIADKLEVNPNIAYGECCKLKARGLVDWMYAEDQVSLSVKGRARSQAPKEADGDEDH